MDLKTAVSAFEKKNKQNCSDVILLGSKGAVRRLRLEE